MKGFYIILELQIINWLDYSTRLYYSTSQNSESSLATFNLSWKNSTIYRPSRKSFLYLKVMNFGVALLMLIGVANVVWFINCKKKKPRTTQDPNFN